MCLWVWGFESLRGHHYRIRKKAANFHEFAAFFISGRKTKTTGGALKKQAVFSISHRETGFFRRKQPFLRKTAKCSLTESPPALMILSVAAEHAANSRKQQQCPRGGIGRRAWFRSMCLRVWGFESLRGHQQRVVNRCHPQQSSAVAK